MKALPTLTVKQREEVILAAATSEIAAVVVLKHNGADITSTLRDELLAAVKEGKHVELTLDLDSYDQTPGVSNRNFVRLSDKAMPKFASSGKGKPFLRDHGQYDSMKVAGRIDSSTLSKDGDKQIIRQSATISAPWAVELALRGLLNTVSTSWRATDTVECSACKAPILSVCWHWPGDKLKSMTGADGKQSFVRDRSGDTTVEWVYNGAECLETSIVPVPAVTSAKITGIRASLSAGMADDEFDVTDVQNSPLPEKIKMSDINPEVTALQAQNARLQKVVDLRDNEKAHFVRLSTPDQDAFLAKSAADRAEMFKVVHTAADGTTFTASDDPRLIAMSKAADADRAAHRTQLAAASAAMYVSRADSELSHLPGTSAQRATLLQAIDGIADEESRKLMLAAVQSTDKKKSINFQRSGAGGGQPGGGKGDPEAQLNELAQKRVDADKEGELSFESAYDQVLNTKEGKALYAEMENAKRPSAQN